MITKIRFLLLAVILCASGTACAALRVSLLTVSAAQDLFEAFGHTGILIEHTESGGHGRVYEYLGVNPRLFRGASPLEGMNELLSSKLPAIVHEVPYDEFIARYVLRRRSVTIDRLNLTQPQARVLESALEKDAARGSYDFGPFVSNCATRPRDYIFALLPAKDEKALSGASGLTARMVAGQAIASTAASIRSRAVRFPVELFAARASERSQMRGMLASFGVPLELRSAADFDLALTQLGKLVRFAGQNPQMVAAMTGMPGAEAARLPALAVTFTSSVGKNGMDRPLTGYESIITPQRLREALLAATNDGGVSLIDPTQTKVVKTLRR